MNSTIDFETSPRLCQLALISRDQGSPQRSDSSRITIEIVNNNDNPPLFIVFTNKNITEDIEIGDFVNLVTASDLDSTDSIEFYISNSDLSFAISSAGVITTNRYVAISRMVDLLIKVLNFNVF